MVSRKESGRTVLHGGDLLLFLLLLLLIQHSHLSHAFFFVLLVVYLCICIFMYWRVGFVNGLPCLSNM